MIGNNKMTKDHAINVAAKKSSKMKDDYIIVVESEDWDSQTVDYNVTTLRNYRGSDEFIVATFYQGSLCG